MRNYGFYVNGKLIGNKTDGKLTVNVSPSNCGKYFGEYMCIPESVIGEGENKTTMREFECKFCGAFCFINGLFQENTG